MAMGVMAVAFNFKGAAPDEFHDWYDTEHIPERRRLRGFLTLQRWIGVEDSRVAVATYDLESLAVLDTPEYRAISGENLSPWSKRVIAKCQRMVRFEGEQLVPGGQSAPSDAAALLLMGMNVAAEAEEEFNRWYDEEHLPALAAVPGVLCARRFRGKPLKYLALYHLASPEVCGGAAWKRAVETPWTQRMRAQVRDLLRILCNAYRREG